jgi:hypothetical protein
MWGVVKEQWLPVLQHNLHSQSIGVLLFQRLHNTKRSVKIKKLHIIHIVEYFFKARIVEAEKRPLLGHDRTQQEVSQYVTCTAVAMERLGKHVRDDFKHCKRCKRRPLWVRSEVTWFNRLSSVQRVSAVQLRVQSWWVNQWVKENEDSFPGNV